MTSRRDSRGRSVLARVALVTASVAFALCVAEVAIRILAFDLNPDPRLRYHPSLGWTSDAGFERFDHVNPEGFRHSISPPNPDGRRRLVILGDSFTFGGAYPFAQTYAGLLDEWLEWDVVNLASGGFGVFITGLLGGGGPGVERDLRQHREAGPEIFRLAQAVPKSLGGIIVVKDITDQGDVEYFFIHGGEGSIFAGL